MTSNYSIVIEKEDDWYVAHCVELGITSQGRSIEEARVNIKEAIELYIETFDDDKEMLIFGYY